MPRVERRAPVVQALEELVIAPPICPAETGALEA